MSMSVQNRSPLNIRWGSNHVFRNFGRVCSVDAYRHTLRHNFASAAIPVDLQAEIGGWEAKGREMSESQAGYAELGKDTNERIKARAKALKRSLEHLLTPTASNVVSIKSA